MARKKKSKARRRRFSSMNPTSAGIDIGARFHVVAVPATMDSEPVRTFKSFTGDLHRMAEWLTQVGVTTVAMESTGIYWVPAFEILEAHGFEVLLVNARSVKNVPGRKTDVSDAQWIQQLHEYGLLRGSFRPAQKAAELRAYLRHRDRLLDYCASHIQHMQKALLQMNVQLNHVVSDITGVTGMSIIRAIVSGQRDPHKLAEFRDVRCKASTATVAAALYGNYRTEHVFTLTQALELYDFYQAKVAECDVRIERALAELSADTEPAPAPLPAPRHKARAPNAPSFDVRAALYKLLGLDLTQIHGIGPYVALRLVGECGTDMSKWPNAKHFTSWLTLAPGNKISGGKLLSSKTRRSSNRAAVHLRLAGVTVGRTQTALGAFYRRLSSRVGKAKAVTATARKIAVLFYNALRYGMNYQDPGVSYYEDRYRRRVLNNLRRRAKSLGYELQDVSNEAIEVS